MSGTDPTGTRAPGAHIWYHDLDALVPERALVLVRSPARRRRRRLLFRIRRAKQAGQLPPVPDAAIVSPNR